MKRLCETCGDGVAGKPAVVTHSSGNHAQALALAAHLCGVEAHIVMPDNCSAVKVQAVKDYGGLVTLCQSTEQVNGGGGGLHLFAVVIKCKLIS